MRRRLAFLVVTLVVMGAAPGLEGDPNDPLPALRIRVASVLDAGSFSRARWGVLAVSLDTGDTLVVRNADAPMVPASNLKLLVTAAALHHLGPDFRWETLLVSDAPVVDGVLQGDLTLYGTGDPGMAERLHASDDVPFDSLAARLRRAGVRRIAGRVVGDGSFFTGPTRLADWDPRDLNDWFTAPSPALSYAENVVQFRIAPSAPGSAPGVHMDPPHGGVSFRNEARTAAGRPGAPLWLLREEPGAPVRVTGEVGVSGRDVYRTMTVQDPLLTASHAMVAALERAGIEVGGGPGRVADPSASILTAARVHDDGPRGVRTLARFRSPPLEEALAVVNRRSHNLYADMILKTLGRVVSGDGSFDGGGAVVEHFAISVLGASPEGVRVLDGSGLSAGNLVTAGLLVKVMAWAGEGRHADAFAGTLPVAGTRELNRRMARTAAAGNLRAKTGTIQGVSALSGVVETRDGERVAFSVLGNGLRSPYAAKRRVEDVVGVALAELRGRLAALSARAQDGQDGQDDG